MNIIVRALLYSFLGFFMQTFSMDAPHRGGLLTAMAEMLGRVPQHIHVLCYPERRTPATSRALYRDSKQCCCVGACCALGLCCCKIQTLMQCCMVVGMCSECCMRVELFERENMGSGAGNMQTMR